MKRYVRYIALLAVITIIFGTIYVVAQQSLRLNANDPQIQLALDTADSLNSNNDINKLSLLSNVNANKSLAPFVVIYDVNGKPLKGNGYLDGKLASIPLGVLQESEGKDYNFVTWQPSGDLRFATVSAKADKYFVMSGRSLKEVEKRENLVLELSAIGWALSLFVIFISYLLIKALSGRRKFETVTKVD